MSASNAQHAQKPVGFAVAVCIQEQFVMNSSGNGSTCACEPAAEEPLDLGLLDHILEDFKGRKGAVIPILQRAQDTYGYLPREVLKAISQKTLIPLNHLYGVATFYAQFHLQRRGRHLIRVCDGTACHVRGSGKNIEAIERSLQVAPGQTSTDYKYTLEIVYCLGSCGLSPVAVVDDKVIARVAPEALVQRLESLE
jgi:NADH:ubiquinone oxidoreductase subunit E